MPEPYRVPMMLNPRAAGWAVDCEKCGKQIRMGRSSIATARRVIRMFGAICGQCREEAPDA